MKRAVMLLVVALGVTALAPLAGQQAAGPAPVLGTRSVPSAASPAQSGPRLQPEWRRFEPSVADTSAVARASLMSSGRHTIVVSTLTLVLIIVIIVLLVVK